MRADDSFDKGVFHCFLDPGDRHRPATNNVVQFAWVRMPSAQGTQVDDDDNLGGAFTRPLALKKPYEGVGGVNFERLCLAELTGLPPDADRLGLNAVGDGSASFGRQGAKTPVPPPGRPPAYRRPTKPATRL